MIKIVDDLQKGTNVNENTTTDGVKEWLRTLPTYITPAFFVEIVAIQLWASAVLIFLNEFICLSSAFGLNRP